ncbi:MAG: EAL domain-containing protein [Porticoccus sp.]|jgi:diguanylate cyclase (GGDEF)-like protein/PAS domain S-box-containing protein|uniref:EAL domain-containing protein n=1 Tax=Porticoccus sp. TaxID=2024853 RepID=UPI003297B3D8
MSTAFLPLLQNTALLLAVVLLYDMSRSLHPPIRPSLNHIVVGLIMGTIAAALMLSPFTFAPGIQFDTRSVLITLTGLFFGTLPTIVTVTIASLFRLYQGGAGAWTGIAVILVCGTLGLLWRHVRASSMTTLGWAELYSLGIVAHVLMLALMLTLPGDQASAVLATITLPVILIYPIATVLLGLLMAKRLQQEQGANRLEENEERLRLALSAAGLGLVDIDLQSGGLVVNEGYNRILGRSLDQSHETLSGALACIHPDDRQHALDTFRRYLNNSVRKQTGELYQEFRIRDTTDNWIWVASLSKVVAWDDSGVPSRMLATLTNINPRKEFEQGLETAHRETSRLLHESTQARLALLGVLEDHQAAEKALRESERALNEVSRIALVGGWEYDCDSEIMQWTQQTCENFGVADNIAPSFSLIYSLLDNADRTTLKESLERCLNEGKSIDLELAIARDKQVIWLRFIAKAARNKQYRVTRLRGTVQDITQRKLAIEKQQHSYNLLMKLAAQVPGMIFQFQQFADGTSAIPWCSPAIRNILGLEADDVADDASAAFDQIHPDDVNRLRTQIRISAEELCPLHTEFRVLLPEQITEWRLCDAIPERLSDGSTLWHGIITDIDSRKENEEALKLAGLVYQNSNEAMMVTDAAGTIIDVNQTFTTMTGYSLQNVVGQNPSILRSGKHPTSFYARMWKALETTGHWEGELWNKRKSGEIFAEWLSINAVYNPDGSVHRWVAQFSDITEKKANEQLIWEQANFDPLTELPNRRMFYDRLGQEIKKAHRSALSMAVLFIDLDHFKEVNDTLGHEKGDQLLVEAASRIGHCIRETDTVARLGGDEFIIILSELEERSTIERVLTSLLTCLSEPYQLDSDVAFVSASIGVTLYPEDATDIEGLLKNADQAMYAAKKEGRNGYQYFTQSMQESALKRMRIVNDLRMGLEKLELWVAYQPIINLRTGNIHKAEALMRWQHPIEGLIGPDTFIPIAEETGLIHLIGHRLFEDVAEMSQSLREDFHPEFQISMNVSPVQLNNRSKNVFQLWRESMFDLGLPGQAVVLEITEGLLLEQRTIVTEQLLAFRDAGIQVALDDFGTGYSSLSYLKKFDIDYLKIDKTFVSNLQPGSEDLALCEAIIVMAHKLGIEVIAEGVETGEQRDLLTAAGCDYAQGYLFAKPMAGESFKAHLLAAQTSPATKQLL